MPRTATMILSGDREVTLTMPNLYQVLAKGGGTPSLALASVMKLLSADDLIEAPNELQRLQQAQANIVGLYEIAALCLTEPQLCLEGEPPPGAIGPDDLAFFDLRLIYYNFFRRDPPRILTLASSDQPGTATDAAPDGDDLPLPPE